MSFNIKPSHCIYPMANNPFLRENNNLHCINNLPVYTCIFYMNKFAIFRQTFSEYLEDSKSPKCVNCPHFLSEIIAVTYLHNKLRNIVSPVKVGFAQYFAVPAVAFVGQRAVAVDAFHAFRVPRPVQHIQKELIHNGFVATRATHHQTTTPATASA